MSGDMIDSIMSYLISSFSSYPPWLRMATVIVIVAGGIVVCAGVVIVVLFLIFSPAAEKAKKQIVRIEFADQPPFVDREVSG